MPYSFIHSVYLMLNLLAPELILLVRVGRSIDFAVFAKNAGGRCIGPFLSSFTVAVPYIGC
jgi:hypothetical protein